MEDCPDPSVWVDWEPGSTWDAHLDACPACRAELASLAEAAEPAPSRRLAFPIAAGFLLAVAALAAWRSRPGVPPSRSSPVQTPRAGIPLVEWMVGVSGEVSLSPGASVRRVDGGLVLERGEARVEPAGDRVRVYVGGWSLEILEGDAVFRASLPALSLWLSAAWAGEEEPPVRVLRGEVRVASGPMEGKVLLPAPGEAVPDPRGWRSLDAAAGSWKDGTRVLLPEAPAFTAEALIRKKVPTAEAFLLFRSNGKGWQAPLGVYLPPSGAWVRVRMEVRDERVSVVAAGQEYFSVSPGSLGTKAYPREGSEALALKACGGDLEMKEARWRP